MDRQSNRFTTDNKLLFRAYQLQQLSLSHTKNALLEQQKNAWRQEYFRLATAEKKLSSDVATNIAALAIRFNNDQDFRLLLEFSKKLDMQLDHFQESLLAPLLWKDTKAESHERHGKSFEFLSSACDKAHNIKTLLENEETEIKSVLANGLCEKMFDVSAKCYLKSQELPSSVPEEFMELDFPDMTMKQALLDELGALDDKYRLRLFELDDNFQKLAPSDWSEADSSLFSHIVNMFPLELPNRKALYMDLLKHIFPHRKPEEFEAHKSWKEKVRFYREQRSQKLDDWKRERWIWLMLSKAISLDEREKNQSLLEKKDAIMRQKDLCLHLRKKVEQWRNDKAIEDDMLEELQSHWLLILQRVQAERTKAETLRRRADKEKLLVFYQRQLLQKREKERIEQEQLRKMHTLSRKRMQLNRLRVSYRAQLSGEQQEARQKRIEEQREEERQKQNRLQQISKMVSIEAKRDSQRVQQPTASFLSRTNDDALPEIKPTFQIYTYNDDQICRDLRVQAERQLREAGLLQMDYARQVLKELEPPAQPRRDTLSAISLADS